jgi:hypothetical protein
MSWTKPDDEIAKTTDKTGWSSGSTASMPAHRSPDIVRHPSRFPDPRYRGAAFVAREHVAGGKTMKVGAPFKTDPGLTPLEVEQKLLGLWLAGLLEFACERDGRR